MSEFLDLPIVFLVLSAIAAIVPVILMTVTSYLKISIILHIFKNAVGANVPPAILITVISLLISMQVAKPVLSDVFEKAKEQNIVSILESDEQKPQMILKELISKDWGQIISPLQSFLRQNTDEREYQFFYSRSVKEKEAEGVTDSNPDIDTLSLVSAYVLSELKAAFTIGVIIYLPFLIIDIVVSHILLGMGLMMMSPMTISMPIKLAVFVLCDGWMLLVSNLINSYQV